MQEKEYLTTREAAEKEGVSIRTVQAWIRNKKLKAKGTIEGYLIKPSDLENFERPKKTGRPREYEIIKRPIKGKAVPTTKAEAA